MKAIGFNDEMVRSILSGVKTQTRRPLKPQPKKMKTKTPIPLGDFVNNMDKHRRAGYHEIHQKGILTGHLVPSCPYGKTGSILWVKEDFCTLILDDGSGEKVFYKATDELQAEEMACNNWKEPSVMAKSQARIWLKVTSISIENIHDITGYQAEKEGVGKVWNDSSHDDNKRIEDFKDLWGNIYGYDAWQQTPYVWAVRFEVLSTTGYAGIQPDKPKELC